MTARTRGRSRCVAPSVKASWESAEFYKQWIDDVVGRGRIARGTGAAWIMRDVNNPHGYEIKHTDLNGIIFDIAAHGRAGSQKNPGADDFVEHRVPPGRLARFAAKRTKEVLPAE